MKKTFLRCGSLLVAAFVLLGAVLLAAPVKASAAEASDVVTSWTLNSSLVPLPDWPNQTPLEWGSAFTGSGKLILSDGSVFDFDKFNLYYRTGSSGEFHFSLAFHGVNDSEENFTCFYEYEPSNSWLDGLQISTIEFNFNPSNDRLVSWLSLNATFQAPPPDPGPLVEVMTDLKEQNQLSQVLTQVVTMIPIGLGCWVGYKGLRKALALLQRILHQA